MFTNKNVKFCYLTSDNAENLAGNRLSFGYSILDGIVHIAVALCRKEDKFSKEEARKVIIERLLKGNDAYVFRLTKNELMDFPSIDGTLRQKILPDSEFAVRNAFSQSLSPDAQKRIIESTFATRLDALMREVIDGIKLEDISYPLMNAQIISILAVAGNKRVRTILKRFYS